MDFLTQKMYPVLTKSVLWKLLLTLPNMSLPTAVAKVGKMRAPQSTLVAERGSVRGPISAGVRVLGLSVNKITCYISFVS